MTAVPFGTLKLARQLREKAGFSSELASKSDLRELEQGLTIRLGSLIVVAVGVLLAAIRYLPAH